MHVAPLTEEIPDCPGAGFTAEKFWRVATQFGEAATLRTGGLPPDGDSLGITNLRQEY
jgi:hypothetical protein